MSTEIQKWSDSAMYRAEPINPEEGPKVYLLWMTPDPLGAIASACKIYKGEVVRSLSDVTDDERLEFFEQVQKTHLKAPLEFVKFHFMIEGVTRAFTHQMVRQRTAVYAQESLRFAVKEDLPVAVPAHLAGTTGIMFKIRAEIVEKYGMLIRYEPVPENVSVNYPRSFHPSWIEWEERLNQKLLSDLEKARYRWDLKVERLRDDYLALIDDGMPAEDARGLLPHNTLTRLHYSTDLRALLEHAGNRLCTQAQFEWRLVFSRLAEALRKAAKPGIGTPLNFRNRYPETVTEVLPVHMADKIADLFRPICYQTGKCEFMAEFDRKCSIRSRVNANHEIGRQSAAWIQDYDVVEGSPIVTGVGAQSVVRNEQSTPVFIGSIQPAEWLLDAGAAR